MANQTTVGYIMVLGQPAPKVKVQVLDSEVLDGAVLVRDQLLKTVKTDINGWYEASYEPSDWGGDEQSWFSPGPDIFLKITFSFDDLGEITVQTAPRPNVQENDCRFDVNIPSDLTWPADARVDLQELKRRCEDEVTRLRELAQASLPESPVERLKVETKSLFESIRNKVMEYFSQSDAVSDALRGAGDEAKTTSNAMARDLRDMRVPVFSELAAEIAEVIGDGVKTVLFFIAGRVENLFELAAKSIIDRPDSEHVLVFTAKEKEVPSVPQLAANTFNHSAVDSTEGFNDSGAKIEATIEDQKGVPHVKISISRNTDYMKAIAERLFDEYPRDIVQDPDSDTEFWLVRQISYSPRRNPSPTSAKGFDMIAADGNRLFAKKNGSNKFYFTSLFDEFPRQLDDNAQNVPGCYLKLDHEDGKRSHPREGLSWWGRYDAPEITAINHPAMNGYDFMPFLKFGLRQFLATAAGNESIDELERKATYIANKASPIPVKVEFMRWMRLFPDIMMIKVRPGIWHEIDSTPPYGSGFPPLAFCRRHGISPSTHSTYRTVGTSNYDLVNLISALIRWLIGHEEDFTSFDIKEVLSIGVANAHRHTHYEDIYGTEISSGPDHVMVGPVLDRGGFWDGTCNFYVLCRLKEGPSNEPYTFGILWMDEQSYFSERWRLLHPEDNDWGRLREWGMVGALKRVFTLESIRNRPPISKTFWCPFGDGLINEDSRMAVSKYVILVTGKVNGKDAIFSIAFNWGGTDRTWRWRLLPSLTGGQIEVLMGMETPRGYFFQSEVRGVVLPQTIALRGDMTIYLKGALKFPGSDRVYIGRWYQKYLPADNWEEPDEEELIKAINRGEDHRPPITGYRHQWRFMSEECFSVADNFSHFGHYEDTPVNARSQFYPVTAVNLSCSEVSEDMKWFDDRSELYTLAPAISEMGDPKGWIKKSPEEKMQVLEQRTNIFGEPHALKLLDRGRLGWIAVHWDKRDDDLMPFKFRDGKKEKTVHVKNQFDDNETGTIRIQRQKRKWSPPIVHEVSFSERGEGELIVIKVHSKIAKKPRSLKEPFFDEIPELAGVGSDEEAWVRSYLGTVDNDPYEWCYRKTPFVNSPEGPFFDMTLWRLKVFVIVENRPWCLLNIKFEDMEFDRVFAAQYIWDISEGINDPCGVGQSHYFATREVSNYLSEEGMCKYGTSVIFEDIVGHVSQPEKIKYL